MSRANHLMAILMAAAFAAPPSSAGEDRDGYRLLTIGGQTVKWAAPVLGRGATITYAVAEATSDAKGRENCRHTTGIKTVLVRSRISRRDFTHALDGATALWSASGDVRFVRVKTNADITITAEAEPDGIAYTDVTPASDGNGIMRRIVRAIVCINPDARWTATNAKDDASYRLSYVLAHEIGHALGLDHPSPRGSLMSFEYDPTIDGLRPSDKAGIVALYGPAKRRITSR